MARIILGSLINDIRNAVGTTVFSTWKGVHYIRRKATTVFNPVSTDQGAIRTKLSAAAARWFSTLTEAQRALWEEYAQNQGSAGDSESAQGSGSIIPSNRGVMSGFNAFCMNNCIAYSAAILTQATWIDDPPAPSADAPLPVSDVILSWDTTPNCCINVAFTPPDGIPSEDAMRIWLRSPDAGPHLQMIAALAGDDPSPSNQCQVNIAKGYTAQINDLPGVYQIQMDHINVLGQRSAPSNIAEVIVPSGCVQTPP